MKIRLILAAIVGGGFLCFYGFQEYKLSSKSSSKPMNVDLKKLEEGGTLQNNHVVIGPHYKIHESTVYEYQIDKGEEVNDRSTVNHAYYPIISADSPTGKDIARLLKKYGSWERMPENLPDDELITPPTIRVLVKTQKYKTVGALPENSVFGKQLQGLVINDIVTLDDETRKLLQQGFEGIDLNNIIIVEIDRKPKGVGFSAMLMAGGVVLILGAIGIGLKTRKPKAEPVQAVNATGYPMGLPPHGGFANESQEMPVYRPQDEDNNPYRRME